MKKRVFAVVLSIALLFTMSVSVQTAGSVDASGITKTSYSNMTKGVWLAFCDFSSLGLYDKPLSTYKKNVNSILNKAKAAGCNTVYFHVRAFDDAAWYSTTFRASEYLCPHAHSYANAKTAYQTELGYDPFGVFVSCAETKGINVEAYMNPYRITYSKFLDPASPYSRSRVYRAVRELKENYNISGIHFDDYFYHSTSKYLYTTAASRYSKNPQGTLRTRKGITAAEKRKNCNLLVSGVYKKAHTAVSSKSTASGSSSVKFGISPAGNYANCMAAGADVKTWCSKAGYVDYISPQIYWTNTYKLPSGSYTKLFNSRLKQFQSLNKLDKPMYVGLALYRAGISDSNDKGWKKYTNNIATQVKRIYSTGGEGYILFEASNLKSKSTAKKAEISNLEQLLAE
ncbi:MAG: family 10 glycosylhydrolase [Eubacteriaceae bacterium]|nr:family 10 glycosylhydrolase [Eubacteriaceae bacterium]